LATIDDVAKAAGVSKSTVSNVFSKKRPISKVVSESVLAAARDLNYKPNYWARSLANKETRIIGLCMEGENVMFGQFHLTLLNGVLEVCYANGYRLLINTVAKEFSDKLENWSSDPVDGEILLDPSVNDKRIEEKVSSQLPLVVIGRPPEPYESRISYVDNDNVGAGMHVAEYLLSLGHRKMLFLNAPKHRTVAQDREAGFRKAYELAGIPIEPKLLLNKDDHPNSSFLYSHQMAKRMILSDPGITAIVVDTDKMALGVYLAATELNLNIPEDLSVIAFSVEKGNSAEFQPPLSCMKLNGELLGREAAKLLLHQCVDPSPMVRRIMIPSELIHRESCAKVVIKHNI
jgi:DNA-binding LacI/PurR family transcriptional regulator